jgi:hypothetical protein
MVLEDITTWPPMIRRPIQTDGWLVIPLCPIDPAVPDTRRSTNLDEPDEILVQSVPGPSTQSASKPPISDVLEHHTPPASTDLHRV